MWYLHFDKREIVLPLEICKTCIEKKMGKSEERGMKDVEENNELWEKIRMIKNIATKKVKEKKTSEKNK